MELAGSVVVITGAGNGIGAALSRELARRGAKLVLNDVDEAALAGVAEQTGAVAVAGDVAQDGDVRALVDAAL